MRSTLTLFIAAFLPIVAIPGARASATAGAAGMLTLALICLGCIHASLILDRVCGAVRQVRPR